MLSAPYSGTQSLILSEAALLWARLSSHCKTRSLKFKMRKKRKPQMS